jgi:hypothetical protein
MTRTVLSGRMAPRWRRRIIQRRAIEEARSILKIETGERAMIAVVAAVGVISAIWLMGGRDIAQSELVLKLSSTAVIIFLFPLVFVWKLLTIPEKLGQIVLGKGKSYVRVEPSGLNRTRIVRVMLKNNTSAEISNGNLHIRNLDPPNNGYKDFLLEDRITLGPHKNTFIDVAAYNEGTSEALSVDTIDYSGFRRLSCASHIRPLTS